MTITTIPLHPNGHRVTGRTGTDIVDVLWREEVGNTDNATMITHLFECRTCGDRPWPRLTADGAYLDTPCPLPDGVTTTITLAVPSGKIIVSDDLRPTYRLDEDARPDINSSLGMQLKGLAMAGIGCAWGFVGNSSPGLYRTDWDTFVIASPEYCEETDEVTGRLAGIEPLTGVCTDTWAYCVADFADFLAKGGDNHVSYHAWDVVEIPAGTYEFTTYSGKADFECDGDGTVIFADIRRVN